MLLKGLDPGCKALEIGCGTGLLTREASKKGSILCALDVSPHLIESARLKITEKNTFFFQSNAYDLGFKSNSFDIVFGMSVLHHLEIDKSLREFRRVLKPGGKMVFTEPNMLNPQIIIERFFMREYFHNTPDETAFRRFSLKRKLKNYNFSNTVIYPFDFLHPNTPLSLVAGMDRFSRKLEKIPILSEIAGSLYIEAKKQSESNYKKT